MTNNHTHSHDHSHGHGHDHAHDSLAAMIKTSEGNEASVIRKVTIVGCSVNAILTAFKIIFGYIGESDALLADGFHSFYDFATDIIVLLLIGVAYRRADDRFAYGYGKVQTFVSLVISIFLILVGVHLSMEGIESITEALEGAVLPKPELSTFVVALVAIFAKEGLFRYTSSAGRRTGSSALLANAWHQRSDALASIATLVGVACSHFLGEKWRILDPCVSLFIAILIIVAGIRIFVPLFGELMERSLPAETIEEARHLISEVKDVRKVVNLKSRRNGHRLIFDVTVSLPREMTIDQGYDVASEIERTLKEHFGKYTLVAVSTCPDSSDQR